MTPLKIKSSLFATSVLLFVFLIVDLGRSASISSLGIQNQNANENSNSNSEGEVSIGKQIWMAQNLDVDRFRNGEPIREAQNAADWQRASENGEPVWCYYNNDAITAKFWKYGKLYNWYAINDPRGLAPQGWHIPSEDDWTTLIDFLGGSRIAGVKMKSKVGWIDHGNGSNSSGFSGPPGGYRLGNGEFYYTGKNGSWWSYTGNNEGSARYIGLHGMHWEVSRYNCNKPEGHSIRCVKD